MDKSRNLRLKEQIEKTKADTNIADTMKLMVFPRRNLSVDRTATALKTAGQVS